MFKKIMVGFLILFVVNAKATAGKKQVYGDTTIVVKVKGVTCKNDLKTLSKNVKELKGVSDCTAGKAGPTSVFNVTYNPEMVGSKEIFSAFENTAGCSDPNDRPYKIKQ